MCLLPFLVANKKPTRFGLVGCLGDVDLRVYLALKEKGYVRIRNPPAIYLVLG